MITNEGSVIMIMLLAAYAFGFITGIVIMGN